MAMPQVTSSPRGGLWAAPSPSRDTSGAMYLAVPTKESCSSANLLRPKSHSFRTVSGGMQPVLTASGGGYDPVRCRRMFSGLTSLWRTPLEWT